MDFYFVKVLMRTRSTGEKGIGYFFGKKNEPPEYRFLVYPRKYDFEGNIDIENDSYYTFLKNSEQRKILFPILFATAVKPNIKY